MKIYILDLNVIMYKKMSQSKRKLKGGNISHVSQSKSSCVVDILQINLL